MAFVHLRDRWTKQPPGPVQVDWANPLTRGLAAAATPHGESVRGGGSVQLAGYQPHAHDYRYGRGWRGNQYFEFPRISYVPPPFSLLVVGWLGFAANEPYASFGGASSGAGWKFDSTGASATSARLTFGGVADYAFSGSGHFIASPAVYVVTVTGTGGTATLYRDSVAVGTVGVATPGAPTKPLTVFAAWNGGGYGYAAVDSAAIFLVAVSRRCWSAGEVAELGARPYQLFRAQRRISYSLPTTGIPVLSAATVTNITANSATPRVTITF